MKTFFRLEQSCVVTELGHNDLCANAAFKLDKPIKIEPDDLLELQDGAWWLTSNEVRVPLGGRWVHTI